MKIAVIGLGYVGCPLAVELAKHFKVVGYDINESRVSELKSGHDRTNEISRFALMNSTVKLSSNEADLAEIDTYIITVPTPVAEGNVPDLNPVKSATKMVGKHLTAGNLVVYESTVYPGVTEEICVPILEEESNLEWKEHFFVGYSPERINPGDKEHTLTTTTKIVAGDSNYTLNNLDYIYGKITKTYRAQSIKIAEAAKVIENTQRDVNIALMNELSHIFSRLGVDTNDVIDAAGSKWNFQKFRPGLVGGHCISIDPYYLSHKAAVQGFVADVILSSREINDSMSSFIVDQLIKLMARNRMLGASPIVTILGCTFKEDVPDIRNSKVFNAICQLKQYGVTIQVFDPLANKEEVKHEYNIDINPHQYQGAHAVILAVPHKQFLDDGWTTIQNYGKGLDHKLVVMDLKASLNRNKCPENIELWRP
jgi:UDP-N-acetyl-D-galactosamine dehydrogenase